jgi:hypothetical protein
MRCKLKTEKKASGDRYIPVSVRIPFGRFSTKELPELGDVKEHDGFDGMHVFGTHLMRVCRLLCHAKPEG